MLEGLGRLWDREVPEFLECLQVPVVSGAQTDQLPWGTGLPRLPLIFLEQWTEQTMLPKAS